MRVIIQTCRCPRCGNATYYYDTVSRHIKEEQGTKTWFDIQRNHCLSCGHVFRLLPDCCVRFKHYRRDIIDGFVSGRLSRSNLEYEDYPCDNTIVSWRASQKLQAL